MTAGKSIQFASGHIHISNIFDENPTNFSHRINRFSFGDTTSGIVHPLEGDEKILTESKYQILTFFHFNDEIIVLMDFPKLSIFRLNYGTIFH